MTLTDVAAAILLEKHLFTELSKATEAVKSTFRKDFPYWRFTDWDVQISLTVSMRILRKYKKMDSPVSVRQLIIDLPQMVNERPA